MKYIFDDFISTQPYDVKYNASNRIVCEIILLICQQKKAVFTSPDRSPGEYGDVMHLGVQIVRALITTWFLWFLKNIFCRQMSTVEDDRRARRLAPRRLHFCITVKY